MIFMFCIACPEAPFTRLSIAEKQTIFPFNDGSGLLITTEIFNLESGRELWGKGVEPDEKIDPKEKGSSAYISATKKILNTLS